MTRSNWHTSSYSNGGTNCVEVRKHESGADMRDSQHRDHGHITFPAAEWSAFLHDAQEGRI